MFRDYRVPFVDVAVTVQQDFFEIVAAAGKPCQVLSLELSQLTEVGDAQEEQLSVLAKSGQTTSGSGGTAPTPVPVIKTDAAAGFTAEVNNTTKASAGTIVTHLGTHWNVRMEKLLRLPESILELQGGERGTIELATTPLDSITISGWILVREWG